MGDDENVRAFDIAMKYIQLESRLAETLDSRTFDDIISGNVDLKHLDKETRNIVEQYIDFSNTNLVIA